MPKAKKQPEKRLINLILKLAEEVAAGGDANDNSGYIDYEEAAKKLEIAAAHLERVE